MTDSADKRVPTPPVDALNQLFGPWIEASARENAERVRREAEAKRAERAKALELSPGARLLVTALTYENEELARRTAKAEAKADKRADENTKLARRTAKAEAKADKRADENTELARRTAKAEAKVKDMKALVGKGSKRECGCLTIFDDLRTVECHKTFYDLTDAKQARELLRFLCATKARSEDTARKKAEILKALKDAGVPVMANDWRPAHVFRGKHVTLYRNAIGRNRTKGLYWINP